MEQYLVHDGNRRYLDGEQKVYRFPNGYGASVVRGSGTYGSSSGLWELAVLKYIGEGDDDWNLNYETPVTDDVEGFLTWNDVEELLQQIFNLEGEDDEEGFLTWNDVEELLQQIFNLEGEDDE